MCVCVRENEWCAVFVCERRRESSINHSIKAACDSDMKPYD